MTTNIHEFSREQLINEVGRLKKEIEDLKYGKSQDQDLEKAIRFESNLYQDLANAQPAGIYRILIKSEESLQQDSWIGEQATPYTIEFINDRFCTLLGLTKQDFVDDPSIILKLIHEEDQAEFARLNVEANKNPVKFAWDGRLVINGEVKWMHFGSLPRQLDNGDVLWTGILNDISPLKQAEDEVRQKNIELKRINAEKDKFFSIIAHDLRTPFNSILGLSSYLTERVQDGNTEEVANCAQIIRESSTKAMDLLTNLMEWVHSQTGRMNFRPEIISISQRVSNSVHLFDEIARLKSIEIITDIPGDIEAHGDQPMIDTVLRNLISNAIKFTPRNGRIKIAACREDGVVKVSVSDTGVGITQSAISKLFSINEKYTTSGTENEQGTGLGLVLCKAFIDKHDGQIGVSSSGGAGTEFQFTIPVAKN